MVHPAIPTPPRAGRVRSLDVVRGLVMALMALDHCRDFMAVGPDLLSPLDPATTNALRYFTRWATHLCAPVFVFLAGVSVRLSLERGRPGPEKARQLLLRGALLVLLELTVVRQAWFFWASPGVYMLQVVWVLGVSMMVCAAFVPLPDWARTAFGLALCLTHNLLDGVTPQDLGSWSWLWVLAHQGGVLHPAHGLTILVDYPLIPWIGLMPLGMAAGRLWAGPWPGRARLLAWGGAALLAAFVALRLWGGYGDHRGWAVYPDPLRTVFSFLDVTKYPPSLLYLLAMLGLAGLAAALAERPLGRLGAWLETFGRVPLFFYVVHLYLLHGLAVAVASLRGGSWVFDLGYASRPPELGVGLGWVYLAWSVCLVALYPACRAYGRLRGASRGRWASLF